MSLALETAPAPLGFLAELRRREPIFAAAALAHLLAVAPVLAAMAVDERMHLDVNIWVKPLKFLVSLTVWFAFLAWAAAWLPAGTTRARWWRPFAFAMVGAAALEMLYIGGAAALGTSSHFNVATPVWRAAYNAAAVMAVTLTSASAVYGALILRNRAGPLAPAFRLAAGLGFLLAFPLTLVAAFTLGGNGGHFVGGAGGSDAAGLPLLGWARDGGDLRPAHFLALHTMHVLPVVGWLAARALPDGAGRLAVLAAAAGWVALTAEAYFGALAGRPFLPFL